jgi:hypothetical protein
VSIQSIAIRIKRESPITAPDDPVGLETLLDTGETVALWYALGLVR